MSLRRMEGEDYTWVDYSDRPLLFLRKYGADLSYDEIEFLTKTWPKTFGVVPATVDSSEQDVLYSANRRAWRNDFKDTEDKNWWDQGDAGIFYRKDIATSGMKDAVERLHGYPVLDEDLYSEMEMEDQTEQWNSWGATQFVEEINESTNEEDREAVMALFNAVPDDVFDKMVYQLWENAGPEGSGQNLSFPFNFWLRDYDGTLRGVYGMFGWPDDGQLGVIMRLSPSAKSYTRVKGGTDVRPAITAKDLPDALDARQKKKLLRLEEIIVPFDQVDEKLCGTNYIERDLDGAYDAEARGRQYIECEYPWGDVIGEVHLPRAQEAQENPVEEEDPSGSAIQENPAYPPSFLEDVVGRIAYAPEFTPEWLRVYPHTRVFDDAGIGRHEENYGAKNFVERKSVV